MKKKIKLRDLTEEQLINYTTRICTRFTSCDSCLFGKVKCFIRDSGSWVLNKDLYSDKFLDQEIEIEVPTFTDKEKEYLHNVLKPYKDRIVSMVRKRNCKFCTTKLSYLKVVITDTEEDVITLPIIDENTEYLGLEVNKIYSNDLLEPLLKELDL